MQNTIPELYIQPTGKCEVWIREINQITQVKLARTEAHRTDTENPTNPTNYATLPQVSDATRACNAPLMENVLVCSVLSYTYI